MDRFADVERADIDAPNRANSADWVDGAGDEALLSGRAATR
jgi:hypothetical protein